MTEQEWSDLKDRELEEALTSLFTSVEKPKPAAGFTAQTMTAVRAAELPAGRIRLQHPLIVPAAWTVLIGGVSAAAYRVALGQPAVANLLASFVALSFRTGLWLFHTVREGLALSGPLAAAGRGVGRALATTEGSAALLVVAAVGAMSFTMLHRLLTTPVGSHPNPEGRY
jgi:hypothetical protein